MTGHEHPVDPRSQPVEWHRRGMSHPDEIAAMVLRRLHEDAPVEPTYGDFFVAP